MSDMPKVLANLVSIGCIRRIIRFHLNCPAVSEKSEVMGGLVMRKSHHFIALLIYVMMVLTSRQHQ